MDALVKQVQVHLNKLYCGVIADNYRECNTRMNRGLSHSYIFQFIVYTINAYENVFCSLVFPHASVHPAQVTDKSDVSEQAKTFAAEWAEAAKYHVDLKYYHMGDGPSAKAIRWGFEGTIKYIIVCATHLADKGNDDFKKEISGYVKDAIIKSLIDHLTGVKVNEILLYFFFFFLPEHQTMR